MVKYGISNTIVLEILRSSPKVMVVLVQYQTLYDNLFGLIWFLVCVYLGTLSVLLANLLEIGRIFIACEASKFGTERISEIKFQTRQAHGSIQLRRSFKVEEWNVSIRWSLLGQPIDYEHGDDSYVLSGGLMLEGCHSTSGEPHSINPHGTITDGGVGIVWLSFDEALQVFDHIEVRTSVSPIQNLHDGFSP